MTDERWRAAWDIYEAACELPAGERRNFAASAIPDTVVTSKVIAMLDSLEASPPVVEPSPKADDEWPQLGKIFGRFAVTGPLGRGATGEVYAGRDTELNRTVALKFLGQGIPGSAGTVDRVVREAQTASALNHPGIVTVYGVIRSGSLFALVMELVEGNSLRIFCGTPQPVSRVANWGRQASLALAAAHAGGIVHRDIKPENLMLRPDGYLKVVDFGLAWRFSVESGSVAAENGGTLRYMSPEQARGEPSQAPGDIFSLGIVLYELVTGVHPFQSESALETPWAIATRVPDTPGARNPSVPVAFSALVMAMLEKDPARRPDAEEVAVRLGHSLRAHNEPDQVEHDEIEHDEENTSNAVTPRRQFAGSRLHLSGRDMQAVQKLAQELSEFPASQTDEAMRWCLAGITRLVGGSNATWIEARLEPNAPAGDPLLGWRPYSQEFLHRIEEHRKRRAAVMYHLDKGVFDPHMIGITAGAGVTRAHVREELVDNRTWLRSWMYNDVLRPNHVEEMLVGAQSVSHASESYICIDRSPEDRPFGERERDLLRLFLAGCPNFHNEALRSHGGSEGMVGRLNPLERDVLHLLLTGLSEKEFAERLGIRRDTAHEHVVSVFRKFKVKDRIGLMALWLRHPSSRQGEAE